MPKIFVINGHGAKILGKTFVVPPNQALVTPGSAYDSYITSFDDSSQHLETMTTQGKIWPITSNGQPVPWTKYANTQMGEVAISPLQTGFNVASFAADLMSKGANHPWGQLTKPPHSPIEKGALAVINPQGEMRILEGAELTTYLQRAQTTGNPGFKEVFFCDKTLGKVKPLGNTTLSTIQAGIALIPEFKGEETATVVATCSPGGELHEAIRIQVQTQQPPLDLSTVLGASLVKETKLSQDTSHSVIEKALKNISLERGKWEPLPQSSGWEQGVSKATGMPGLATSQYVITFGKNNEIVVHDKHNNYQIVDAALKQQVLTQLISSMQPKQPVPVVSTVEPIATADSIATVPPPPPGPPPSVLTVAEIVAKVGGFSSYQTVSGAGEDIPLDKKPAQQLLKSQGCADTGEPQSLSSYKGGELTTFKNAEIPAFDGSGTLKISSERLEKLKKSAKTYVNADIISEATYKAALGKVSGQSKDKEPGSENYWQNMAVGLCHAQVIDLLVEQHIGPNGQAVSKPRIGEINDNEPGVLLLSAPALNERYGVGTKLTAEEKRRHIEGMFRNLFHATQSEGRNQIAMPPAGLGAFGGDPKMYFAALNKVAAEFPDITIHYNPAQNGALFDSLADSRPPNVHKTTQDVVFLAAELSKNGYPCALHNPSDADVVFGMYDPGEYWKDGTGPAYVGEEHIGAMSTAPMNGFLMNPNAYHNCMVKQFTQTQAVESMPTTQPHTPLTPASAAPPISFALDDDNNQVTGVEAMADGRYKFTAQNTAGQERTVFVNTDGSIVGPDGKMPNGHVATSMAAQAPQLFKHFGITPPANLQTHVIDGGAHLFAPHTSAYIPPAVKKTPPFALDDDNNRVMSLEAMTDGRYKFTAQNTAGQVRTVFVNTDGSIVGPDGKMPNGHVATSMAMQAEEVFKHFGVTPQVNLKTPFIDGGAHLATKQATGGTLINMHISPDLAKKIYQAVDAIGQGTALKNLSNEHTPAKMSKALQVLGIAHSQLAFKGYDGYKVGITLQSWQKLQQIAENPKCMAQGSSTFKQEMGHIKSQILASQVIDSKDKFLPKDEMPEEKYTTLKL